MSAYSRTIKYSYNYNSISQSLCNALSLFLFGWIDTFTKEIADTFTPRYPNQSYTGGPTVRDFSCSSNRVNYRANLMNHFRVNVYSSHPARWIGILLMISLDM